MIPVAEMVAMEMKNKIVTMTLSMAVLISSISCSSDTPSKASKKSGTPYTASSVTSYNADASDNFSDGYTFMQLTHAEDYGDTDTFTWLLGCIDTKGKLQYSVELLDNAHFYAKNGFTQIREESRWICINQKGNIEYIYEASNSGTGIESQILCGGDSFILVSERNTGFETDDMYTYKIIDYLGNIVLEYQDIKTYPEYKGNGIFYLNSETAITEIPSKFGNAILFNANTADFIESSISSKYISDHYGEIYKNGNYINRQYLSLSDGTLIDLSNYIEYDRIDCYEKDNTIHPDAAQNEYFIYYNDDVPYLFNFGSKQSYDCFNSLTGHNIEFMYYGKHIIALVNGDDNNTYFMIVDKDGQIINELTALPDSFSLFNSIIPIFYDNKIVFSYYGNSKLNVIEYNLNNNKITNKDMTNKDRLEIKSDFYDDWAKAIYLDYSSDGHLEHSYKSNYVNKEGDFLLDVDENGYPLFYVKDSQILKY